MEGTIIEAVSFKRLAGISSDPVALLVSNEVSKISTSNSDRLRSVKTGSFRILNRKVFSCKYGGEVGIEEVSYFVRVCSN